MSVSSWFAKPIPPHAKPGEFQCPLCGQIVPLRNLLTHAVADDALLRDGRAIAQIKRDHPDWVEADGACPRCVAHYRSTL